MRPLRAPRQHRLTRNGASQQLMPFRPQAKRAGVRAGAARQKAQTLISRPRVSGSQMALTMNAISTTPNVYHSPE